MEIWKRLKEYSEDYEVSSKGRIKSIKYGRDRILKTHITTRGYEEVCLRVSGKSKHLAVHRLVAKTFLPNLENFPEINHKDENRLNNTIENLEWCTRKYNMEYSKLHEKLRKAIIRINPVTNERRIYDCIVNVKLDGYDDSAVSKCCKGKRKMHKGYIWEYKVSDICITKMS